jgi:signal peptidase I
MTDRHVDPAGTEERTDGATRSESSHRTSTQATWQPPGEPARAEDRHDGGDHRSWRELPVLVLVALVVAILIKSFLVQAFFIPSASMEPTLLEGDRVLVCRICYRISDIQRGDVIVFSDPAPSPSHRGTLGAFVHWLSEGIGLAQPQDEDFIKRVVGLPGDVVELRSGQLIVNERPVDEPYLNARKDTRSYGPVTVPDGNLFVLGDNRTVSGDSRLTPAEGGVGLVPEDKVIGKAFVIVWPPGRWGGI